MRSSRRLMIALAFAERLTDPAEKVVSAGKVRSAAQKCGNFDAEVTASVMIIDALFETGDLATRRSELRGLADRSDLPNSMRLLGNQRFLSWQVRNQALSLLLEQAEDSGESAAEIDNLCAELIERAPGPFARGTAYSQVAHSLMRRHQAGPAIDLFRRGAAAFDEVAAVPERAEALENAAAVCCDIHRYDDAVADARTAIGLYELADGVEGLRRAHRILSRALDRSTPAE